MTTGAPAFTAENTASLPISSVGGKLRADKPRLLFSDPDAHDFDTGPEGLVMVKSLQPAPAAQLNVILGWTDQIAP
jgi:hypothetical protein